MKQEKHSNGPFIHSYQKFDDEVNNENKTDQKGAEADDEGGGKIVERFKDKYDKQPDILKSCFIMEVCIFIRFFLFIFI